MCKKKKKIVFVVSRWLYISSLHSCLHRRWSAVYIVSGLLATSSLDCCLYRCWGAVYVVGGWLLLRDWTRLDLLPCNEGPHVLVTTLNYYLSIRT